MGLEQNSLTIASHMVMVVILFMLAGRALSTFNKGLGGLAISHGLMAAIAIACVGLSIERLYYVAARFLLGKGLNLWQMHPAPEFLSLIVGTGIYGLMIPLLHAQISDRRRLVIRVLSEVIGLACFWVIFVWIFF